ncbi:hypothetical protein [Streptomyces sp. NPDC004533]
MPQEYDSCGTTALRQYKMLGCCLECFDGTHVDPGSYIAPPASGTHRLAA